MDESLNSPCAELRQLVTEYLEEVMTGEELAWFESHVHECGSCEVHVHEVKAFVGVLARCRPEPVSAGGTSSWLCSAATTPCTACVSKYGGSQ